MSDELDSLSDAQLSEVFAVEVAGWMRGIDPNGRSVIWPPYSNRKKWKYGISPEKFATDANAVLPFLDSAVEFTINRSVRGWQILFNNGGYAGAGYFARCACIAIIRARRLDPRKW